VRELSRPNFLAEEVFGYARSHPSDERVPQALHFVVFHALRVHGRGDDEMVGEIFPVIAWAISEERVDNQDEVSLLEHFTKSNAARDSNGRRTSQGSLAPLSFSISHSRRDR
jgi:hypothetical protein